MNITNIAKSSDILKVEKELQKNRILFDSVIAEQVRQIISDVRENGDKAVLEYTKKFDKVDLKQIKVSKKEIEKAKKNIPEKINKALVIAKKNIIAYQNKCKQDQDVMMSLKGLKLGNVRRPLDRVGCYIPGGTAPLVSTVLMTVLLAKQAGVREVVVVTPPLKDGSVHPYILAACDLCGVDEIYVIGGAQAIAALACGTETIKKVDKIVGPGNIYVSLAKKEVYGRVDIDMVAGPSEILVVADDDAKPKLVAADLMSQAEHDVLARTFLICFSKKFAHQVIQAFEEQMKKMPRKDIIEKSWKNHAQIFIVKNIEQVIELVNLIAPEHLELMIKDAEKVLPKIKNAGAVFIGQYTPEAMGDYIAGPSHVLPTFGSAKYFSVLSVNDFYKNTSVIFYDKKSFLNQAPYASILAGLEGLDAHKFSIETRLNM